MLNRAAVLVLFVLASCCSASAKVVLIGRNRTLTFDDADAIFAAEIRESGECGKLYLAEPLDACSDLTNEVKRPSNASSPFVLMIRGGCSFEDKVKRAQKAGYKAAIVYDNGDDGILISMAGNPFDIKIHAVFVSKASGETLKNYALLPDMELWLFPSLENSAWSIMASSFISLLIMSGMLAICFFVRRQRTPPRHRQFIRIREFHGMSTHLVEAMPTLIFTSVLEDNCTSSLCAICLEDYSVGDKLRILPCRHKFHALCVDSWLTAWRTFCPVCKRDARSNAGHPPASESTPLLSSNPASVSSSVLSSARPPLQSSSNIRTASALRSRSISLSHSHASSPYHQPSQRSYHQSPPIPVSRSSVDLRNYYSQISHMSHTVSPHSSIPDLQQLQRFHHHQSPPIPISRSSVDLRNFYSQRVQPHTISPHSLGYPSLSPLNTRRVSQYTPNPSAILISSSGHCSHPSLQCSESTRTVTPFSSTHSLLEY